MSSLLFNKIGKGSKPALPVRFGVAILLAGLFLSITDTAKGRHLNGCSDISFRSIEKARPMASTGIATKHPDAALAFNYAGHGEFNTKIFIVRHADRLGEADELSALGTKRASELKRVLMPAKIDSVFSTDFVRTKKTAQPLASSRRLPVRIYSDELALVKRIIKGSSGKRVLVVGHSNTVDDIIKSCGCVPPASIDPEMPITQFDNLFLVLLYKVPGQLDLKCELVHMKYGAVTN
jgi:phosphohistidine phosphatase SixA